MKEYQKKLFNRKCDECWVRKDGGCSTHLAGDCFSCRFFQGEKN